MKKLLFSFCPTMLENLESTSMRSRSIRDDLFFPILFTNDKIYGSINCVLEGELVNTKISK